MRNRFLQLSLACLIAGIFASTWAQAKERKLETTDTMIPTAVAAHDLGVAVDYILQKRKVSKIDLMGWSWGTSIAGPYTSEYWSAGKALYDPGKVTVPTLLLHAEWDADLPSYLAQGYFAQLKNTPYKRLIELSEGTHTVMLEKNRMQFFHELMGFLDEERPLALK